MKVFYVIRSTFQFHYNRSIVEALITRGHTPLVFFEKSREKWTNGDYFESIEEFQKEYPDFTYGWSYRRSDWWRHILLRTRAMLTYRRYLLVTGQSRYIRERNRKYLPWALWFLLWFPLTERATKAVLATDSAGRFLNWVDDLAGVDSKILQHVRSYSPDIVIVMVGGMRYGSLDIDYIKAAKALGIPCVVQVLSWDSVSSKGFIQVHPDALFAWNKTHFEQAIEHHKIPPEKIRIVGAPVFDRWFSGMKPTPRETFCRAHGLDPGKLIITYLGSPSTIAKDERWLVEELKSAMASSSDEKIRSAQIIFRPHPENYKPYANFNRKEIKVIPKVGLLPDTLTSIQLFYDTLYHSLFAADVNTSAVIEATLMNKPVIAAVRQKYYGTQSEAQHFRQMLDYDVLILTKTPEEFVGEFKKILAGQDRKKEERRAFIKKFIRPKGLDITAGMAATLELEKLIS